MTEITGTPAIIATVAWCLMIAAVWAFVSWYFGLIMALGFTRELWPPVLRSFARWWARP